MHSVVNTSLSRKIFMSFIHHYSHRLLLPKNEVTWTNGDKETQEKNRLGVLRVVV